MEGLLRPSWGVLGASWAVLRPSWASWNDFSATRSPRGLLGGRRGALLGRLWALELLTPGGSARDRRQNGGPQEGFLEGLTRPRRILPGTWTEWSRTAHTAGGSGRIEDAGGASPAAPWEFDVASREPLGLSGASWKQVRGLLGAGLGPLLGLLGVSWGLLGGLLGGCCSRERPDYLQGLRPLPSAPSYEGLVLSVQCRGSGVQ